MNRIIFKLIFPSLVLVAGLVIFYKFFLLDKNSLFYWSFCDKPIHYKLGTVDSRFNLSPNDFLADISQAENIWENADSKNLFAYDPKGDLTINLVFDQRQSLNNQIDSLENQIQTGKNSINPQIAQYESLSAEFKKKVSDLNTEIALWNSQGGAPPNVYEKLKSEQQDLKNQADKLNEMARVLNQSTQQFNTQVSDLHATVQDFNQVLQNKPEEGVFSSKNNTIDIYFDINQKELIHTLAHEMGHSLSMQHVVNEKSIMYPYTTQEITPSADDIKELNIACQKYTIVELALDKLSIGLHQIILLFQKK